MMQASVSGVEYAAKNKVTQPDRVLGKDNALMQWLALVAETGALYSKGEGRGQPQVGVERNLRLYIVQQSLGNSGEGTEDVIYDNKAIQGFVGLLHLSRESAPDATTLLKFSRQLEERKLTERIFAAINTLLGAMGLLRHKGTVGNAAIIAMPSSTKNQESGHDPEMLQPKGQSMALWHEGSCGVGAEHGNTPQVAHPGHHQRHHPGDALLHGEDRIAFGEALLSRCREEGSEPRHPTRAGSGYASRQA